jgi:hypothetical protein
MNTSKAKEIVKISVARAVVLAGSQTKLAEKADLTQGAIGKYLRGEALPTGPTAKRLVAAVDGALNKKDFAPHIFDD